MSLATSDVDFLRGLVAAHSGNVIAPRQVYMLEQRLNPLAQKSGLEGVQELVLQLRHTNNPALSRRVAEAVTVNESSFFRDLHMFDALRKTILPDLIRKNQGTRSLRIWCAACSSGQEPYSTAMVIQEHFPNLANWNVEIVATDYSEEMLAKSRSGQYTQLEINRGLPTNTLVKFFDRTGSLWQAKKVLREMIEHRRMNLTRPWPSLGTFDIVMIRNVLIYFDQATKNDVLNRVTNLLSPEGYMFIGSSESLIGLGLPFTRQEIDGTVSYRPN